MAKNWISAAFGKIKAMAIACDKALQAGPGSAASAQAMCSCSAGLPDSAALAMAAAARAKKAAANQALQASVASQPSAEIRLCRAVLSNQPQEVAKLLGARSLSAKKLNETIVDGGNALMHAARVNSPEMIGMLLAARMDAAWKNEAGRTALMVAAGAGSQDAVRALRQRSHLMARDKEGMTALALAVEAGRVDCAELLSPERTGAPRAVAREAFMRVMTRSLALAERLSQDASAALTAQQAACMDAIAHWASAADLDEALALFGGLLPRGLATQEKRALENELALASSRIATVDGGALAQAAAARRAPLAL